MFRSQRVNPRLAKVLYKTRLDVKSFSGLIRKIEEEMSAKQTSKEIKEAVRSHYAEAIKQESSCCGGPQTVQLEKGSASRFVDMSGYEAGELPEGVTSFGCGNPVTFAKMNEGETVLDLGSGAGLDLILAAKKVGAAGQVIGLDMTDEMIETCERNLSQAGVKNGEVRKGEMEEMPVANEETDWIISNCVINLSPEKEKVFAEAFRVLKPGGQMLVSDIVTLDLPEEYRSDIKAWVRCIGGAVDEADYLDLARNAGFVDVEVVDRMTYDPQGIASLANDNCGCGDGSPTSLDKTTLDKFAGKVASVKMSARKPS